MEQPHQITRRNTGQPCQDRGTCGVRRQTEPETATQWALTRCPVPSGSGPRAAAAVSIGSGCRAVDALLRAVPLAEEGLLAQGQVSSGAAHVQGLVRCRDTKSTPLARLEQLGKPPSSRATCAISCSANARQV